MKTPKNRPDQDDCNCGKPLKQNDPRRKQAGVKKVIKKRLL
jgi:hypothetical protein